MNRHRTGATTEIPILGVVRAGAPIPLPGADAPPLDIIEVPESACVPSSGIFGLLVRGDSMIDAKVYDGDTIIIKPQNTAADGDLVVARLHDDPTNLQTTFKRFYRNGDLIHLQPENSDYRPITLKAKDVEIIGVVMAVWRGNRRERHRMR